MNLSAYNSGRLFYDYGVPVDQEARRKLEKANWKKIIPELTKYAFYKVKGRRIAHGIPLEGTDVNDIAEDLVMDAIKKIINGDVIWDPNAKPDLLIYLKSVVKSGLSHLYDDKENKITRRFPSVQKENGPEPIEVEELMDIASSNEGHTRHLPVESPQNPEAILIRKQNEDEEEAFTDELITKIEGEKDLEEMFLLIMDGYSKPREIAEQMRVDVKQVYNMQKRLRRQFNYLHNEKKR